ncbi:hypothetical protein RIR_jg24378.t1 [Rhizophagus irregularis DAOM 181602=DAOM 197198]|nr:hypothetical protein RIR_jg24378.t1 [Rhizophagus irregularis DAOM 181602=DAOM 197198]
MVSALPEKLLEKISSMPVLCVQFNGELKFLCICNYFAKTLICYIIGASTEIYLDNWSTNMRPIRQRCYHCGHLNKKYQVLLKKAADYYLDEDNYIMCFLSIFHV